MNQKMIKFFSQNLTLKQIRFDSIDHFRPGESHLTDAKSFHLPIKKNFSPKFFYQKPNFFWFFGFFGGKKAVNDKSLINLSQFLQSLGEGHQAKQKKNGREREKIFFQNFFRVWFLATNFFISICDTIFSSRCEFFFFSFSSSTFSQSKVVLKSGAASFGLKKFGGNMLFDIFFKNALKISLHCVIKLQNLA